MVVSDCVSSLASFANHDVDLSVFLRLSAPTAASMKGYRPDTGSRLDNKLHCVEKKVRRPSSQVIPEAKAIKKGTRPSLSAVQTREPISSSANSSSILV